MFYPTFTTFFSEGNEKAEESFYRFLIDTHESGSLPVAPDCAFCVCLHLCLHAGKRVRDLLVAGKERTHQFVVIQGCFSKAVALIYAEGYK